MQFNGEDDHASDMREIIAVMRESVRKDAETRAKCVRVDRSAFDQS